MGAHAPILHLFIGEEYILSKEMIEKRMKKQGQMNFIENSEMLSINIYF